MSRMVSDFASESDWGVGGGGDELASQVGKA